MDGENNGKPYENGMIWGYPYFRKHPYSSLTTDFKPALLGLQEKSIHLHPPGCTTGHGHQPWGRYVKSIGPAALAGYFLGVAGVLGQQAGKGKEGWWFHQQPTKTASGNKKHVEQRSPIFFWAGGRGGRVLVWKPLPIKWVFFCLKWHVTSPEN